MMRGLWISWVLIALVAGWAQIGPAHAQDARSVQQAVNHAQQLADAGRADEAIPLLRTARDDAEALWGQALDYWTITLFLADVLQDEGQLTEAEQLYRATLAAFEGGLDPLDFRIALTLNNLGLNLIEQGRYPEALILLERVVGIRTETDGPEAESTLIALANQAVAMKSTGRYVEAETLQRRILARRRATLENDDPVLALALNNLGNTLIEQGELEEAETLLREALTIREGVLGLEHPLTAQTTLLLSSVLAQGGRLDVALAMHERGMAVLMAHAPPHDLASAYLSGARLNLAVGRTEEAEKDALAALALLEALFGPSSIHTAWGRVVLADVLLERGRAEEAMPLLLQALADAEAALGPDQPSRTHPLFFLAVAQGETGDRAGAIQSLRQAHALADRLLPLGHPVRLDTLADLASALAADRQSEAALPLLRQAGQGLIDRSGLRVSTDRSARYQFSGGRRVFRLTVTAAWDAAHRP